MEKKITTLCCVYTKTHVLLGMKKRGFGEGRWNGFGGKVQLGEGIEECARRELREEAGIIATEMRIRGRILFKFEDNGLEGNPDIEVNIYSVTEFEGVPSESEEMLPKWFAIEEIPFAAMWPDDIYLMSLLLEGKNFVGEFCFGDINNIISHNITEVDEL